MLLIDTKTLLEENLTIFDKGTYIDQVKYIPISSKRLRDIVVLEDIPL